MKRTTSILNGREIVLKDVGEGVEEWFYVDNNDSAEEDVKKEVARIEQERAEELEKKKQKQKEIKEHLLAFEKEVVEVCKKYEVKLFSALSFEIDPSTIYTKEFNTKNILEAKGLLSHLQEFEM